MIWGYDFADWLKKAMMDKDEIYFSDLFMMRLNAFTKILFYFAMGFFWVCPYFFNPLLLIKFEFRIFFKKKLITVKFSSNHLIR